MRNKSERVGIFFFPKGKLDAPLTDLVKLDQQLVDVEYDRRSNVDVERHGVRQHRAEHRQ